MRGIAVNNRPVVVECRIRHTTANTIVSHCFLGIRSRFPGCPFLRLSILSCKNIIIVIARLNKVVARTGNYIGNGLACRQFRTVGGTKLFILQRRPANCALLAVQLVLKGAVGILINLGLESEFDPLAVIDLTDSIAVFDGYGDGFTANFNDRRTVYKVGTRLGNRTVISDLMVIFGPDDGNLGIALAIGACEYQVAVQGIRDNCLGCSLGNIGKHLILEFLVEIDEFVMYLVVDVLLNLGFFFGVMNLRFEAQL